jgi:hypothetical protein
MKTIDKLNRPNVVKLFFILGLVAFVVAAVSWWQYSYSTPERVFNRMIGNSLSTKSVTKSSGVNAQAQSVEQTTVARIESEPQIHSRSTVSQGQGEQANVVSRESLVTLTNNYIKLNSIKTSQRNTDGQEFDFSSVLNIWGSAPATENDNSLAQLYSQNVAVPFADLTHQDRQEIEELIKSTGVYEVDFGQARRVKQDGRDMFIFNVSVKPDAFISMMKSIGHKVGLNGYDDVDPAAYSELPTVPFTFVVDIMSANLVSVDYGDGQVENYSSYGLRYKHPVPTDTVTMTELQQRLQALQ